MRVLPTHSKTPKSAPALRACAGRPNLRLGRPLAWRYTKVKITSA